MKTFKDYVNEKEQDVLYPGGVYISVQMAEESVIHIKEYMAKYLPGKDGPEEDYFHSTLIYSKQQEDRIVEVKEYTAMANVKHFSKFGEKQEVLVCEIESPILIDRNTELVEEYGFISDFEEYKPHFTLTYDASDVDINSLPPIDFIIKFENETVSPLDTDWSSKTKEDKKELKTWEKPENKELFKSNKKEEEKEEDDKK